MRDLSYVRVYRKIYTYLGIFSFLEVKVLGNVFIWMFAWSVQIISGLDSQSKFQILTLFSGRHVGLVSPLEVHQHGGSILGSVNFYKIFRGIFEDRVNAQT